MSLEQSEKKFIEALRAKTTYIYVKSSAYRDTLNHIRRAIMTWTFKVSKKYEDSKSLEDLVSYFEWSPVGLEASIIQKFDGKVYPENVWTNRETGEEMPCAYQTKSPNPEEAGKYLYEAINKIYKLKNQANKMYGTTKVVVIKNFQSLRNNAVDLSTLIDFQNEYPYFNFCFVILSPYPFSEIPPDIKSRCVSIDWDKLSESDIEEYMNKMTSTDDLFVEKKELVKKFIGKDMAAIESIACLSMVRGNRKITPEIVETIIKEYNF